jgi:hypothetical protein
MPPISRRGNVPLIRLPVAAPNSTVPRVFHHTSSHKSSPPKALPGTGEANSQDEPKPTNFHHPLKFNEIRILEIFRDHDDCLAANLRTIYLNQPFDPYFAISYAWGDRKAAFRIRIDNKADFLIPAKQYEMLETIQMLSNGEEPVRVWMDLLCIDQANILEKNRQVSLMGDIFRKAQAVFAYVGVNDSLDPLALMQSMYWMRRWIVQELVLAQEVFILAGGTRLNWAEFVAAVESADLKSDDTCFRQYVTFRHIRHRRSRILLDIRDPSSLGSLLREFRLTQCTEPYDRIYALLSLASLKDQSRIEVDYTKSLFGLFLEVTSLVASEHSRIEPYMMETLYEDLASKKEKHILPGFRQFASRSPWMDIGPVMYFGCVEDADTAGATASSMPDVDIWTIKMRPAVDVLPLPSDALVVSELHYWRTIIHQAERYTIEPGDLCFQVMPFTERILLARTDEHGQLKCYGRAERFDPSEEAEAASGFRHFLSPAIFNLSSANSDYIRRVIAANTYCIAESVSAKLNGAALVESIYRWSPEVDSTGELEGIGALSSILDSKILNEIRRNKGGVASSLESHNVWRATSDRQERQRRKERQVKAVFLGKRQAHGTDTTPHEGTPLNPHEGQPARVQSHHLRYLLINSILVAVVLSLITLLLRDGWNHIRSTPR